MPFYKLIVIALLGGAVFVGLELLVLAIGSEIGSAIDSGTASETDSVIDTLLGKENSMIILPAVVSSVPATPQGQQKTIAEKPKPDNMKMVADKDESKKHSRDEFYERLAQASGKSLQQLLAGFWQQCTMKNRCQAELAQLQQTISPNFYEMLSTYLVNQVTREQLMGSDFIAHDSSLEDKITRVKMIDQQAWGKYAGLLFADEYALYDFSLQGGQLGEVINVDEFVAGYQTLTGNWQQSLENFGLKSPQAKYEQALNLLPPSFSASQRQTAQNRLADYYLTPQQQTSMQIRVQEVQQQTRVLQDYQQGLEALNKTLLQLRQTSKAHLSPVLWQDHQSKQRYLYRLDFFGS